MPRSTGRRPHDGLATIHFALEDAGGDSAIIEFAGGEPVVHHGRQLIIMTNDPTYDEQLGLLAHQDFSHPNSSMPLPGNVNAVDRYDTGLIGDVTARMQPQQVPR